jgi:hypothetical protein
MEAYTENLIKIFLTPPQTQSPFKTSEFFRGEGVKNLANLPMNSCKNCSQVGVGVKNHEKLPTS